MTPLRIVYVWDADYPWDVRTEKSCLALTAAGHDVHIIARNKKWSAPVEQLPEGTVHRIAPFRWAGRKLDNALGFPAFFNPRWINLLSNTVKETSADVIIVRDLPLCPTAIHVGRRLGVPVVFDMAENYPALMRALWETNRATWLDWFVRNPKAVVRVEEYSVKNVEHTIVVVEESAWRLFEMGVPESEVTLVSNTPFTTRISESPAPSWTPKDHIDIVYLGNIEVVRGMLESIEAIAKLRADGHDVRLRLIGKGRDNELVQNHARSLGLGPDSVEFLGYIPNHKDALAIVASADIGLMPHQRCELWNTTIPNKMFDYMAAGLPVLSSDAAPCARILGETGAGVIFKSKDSTDIANAVVKLKDAELRKQIGQAGQRAIREKYNWEADSALFVRTVEDATHAYKQRHA